MVASKTVFRYLRKGQRVICTHNLEEIIKRGDLAGLKKLVTQEPDLVFSYSEPLSMTPLFYAAQYQQLPIVKYLLSRGANPSWVNMQHVNLVEFSRKAGNHTPLSRLFKNKLQLQQNVKKHLQATIRKILEKQMRVAKIRNKKIIILLGEAHGNYATYEVEKIFLKVAKDLGVTNLFYEFPKQYHLDKPITRFAEHKLSMNVHKIDNHPRRQITASIQERNVVMTNEISGKKQHGVVVVGANHLKGMLEESDSQFDTQQFHLVPFNLRELAKQQYAPYPDNDPKSPEMLFAEDERKIIQVGLKNISDPQQVVNVWNSNKCNITPRKLSINIVPILCPALCVLAAFLFGWITPLVATLAITIPVTSFCLVQYFKIRSIRNYQLPDTSVAQLQAFLDGTQNTPKQNMLSCFSFNDWRYMQDYYAGRATAEIGNKQLILHVDLTKKALSLR